MNGPGPAAMLVVALVSITLYLFLVTLLLKMAARWVTGCILGWGQGLKIVLLVFVAGLITQFVVGITAVFVAGYTVEMLQVDPFFNLLAFLFLMTVSSYIYGNWIRCEQHAEGVGFAKGLLVFWAQVLIVVLVALGLAILIGTLQWLMQ
ncbi:hypothetical protein SAMN05443662_0580 [Sulfurivirga caldicuralii]|uniref:Uncharacterized protein n=1 Tax=Sulfurivirga caldicuralii TaxID=364032 RepID=A0A1N6E440_9GAMM|nr:hypothetical protein [Sulfurivirga caldicuralii]SIN77808.1 hypothetical protein SAMN05443662_0580 [Sulfurivirga caldicuralii]